MNKNQMTEFSFEKETNLFVPQYELNKIFHIKDVYI